MSSVDVERLDAIREDLEGILVRRVLEVSGGLTDGGATGADAAALLGAVKAAGELANTIISTEVELRRLERQRAKGAPGAGARLEKLTGVRRELVEGLSQLVREIGHGR